MAAEDLDAGTQRVETGNALVPTEEANDGPAENYLIVGSDSRANFDPDAEDEIAGEGTDQGCKCSDTLMVLRRDPDNGASLLSIPRDLWVEIPGYNDDKINSAYGHGPETVINTVESNFGIQIDHYVEIDFAGFVTLVDAIGGVEVCVENLARDKNTGMELQQGCQMVDGVGALSYARSRYYEEFIDGDWVEDPRSDLGRIDRQQKFIESAVNGLLEEIIDNPGRIGDLIDVAKDAITFDEGADLFATADALAAAAGEGLHTYSLAVERWESPDGQDSLELLESESRPILDYFRGVGPLPPETTDSSAPDSSG